MVVTIPGITQSTNAIVSVSSIDSAVGKTIEILGVGTDRSRNVGRYNGVYPIIDIPSPKTVRYNTNYINAGIYTGSEGIFHVMILRNQLHPSLLMVQSKPSVIMVSMMLLEVMEHGWTFQ